jgi:hypothetical protein
MEQQSQRQRTVITDAVRIYSFSALAARSAPEMLPDMRKF